MIEFYIAKRHILERKKQSLISILGITIGIVVLVVSIGISNGLDKNMISSILSLTSHVVVEDRDGIDDYENLTDEISKLPKVKGVIPTVDSQGILKYTGIYGNYVSGIKINGFDLEKAKSAIDLENKIIKGEISTDSDKILVGQELVKITGMDIGDHIKIISSENNEIDFTIGGIFQSGYYDYDVSMVIIPLRTAQYMSYGGDTVDKLSISLNNPYDADKIKEDIQNQFYYHANTWGDMNRNLLSALALEKTVMILVFSLIVIIAGFVVWVTLNTLVREKIKDIGIMRSMGFSKENIMKIFLIQGVILGILGICIGLIISLSMLWYLKYNSLSFITSIYYLTKIPVEISIKEIIIIVSSNTLIIFISSIFPAYRAAKMENVEALRHD